MRHKNEPIDSFIFEDEDGGLYTADGHHPAPYFARACVVFTRVMAGDDVARDLLLAGVPSGRVQHLYAVPDPWNDEYRFWQSSPTRLDDLAVHPITMLNIDRKIRIPEQAWVPPAPCESCEHRQWLRDDLDYHDTGCSLAPKPDPTLDGRLLRVVRDFGGRS